jgi:hypothetical protein
VCVGVPGGERCPSEGVLSLLGLVPACNVADVESDGPVLVHLTVCREHVREARRWLQRAMLPGDEIDTYGTELLMAEWGQVAEVMGDTPVWRLEPAAA